MNETWEAFKEIWAVVVGLFALVVLVAWFQANQEAKIFNRCTGSNISTWDALWADFRVFDCKGR